LSAVDEVAVGIVVRDAKGAVEEDSAVKVDTGSFAEVHVSFDTPNGPKLVVMAVVKVLAKDRAALTITLGLLKSNLVT
jgi:hypothetical protein